MGRLGLWCPITNGFLINLCQTITTSIKDGLICPQTFLLAPQSRNNSFGKAFKAEQQNDFWAK